MRVRFILCIQGSVIWEKKFFCNFIFAIRLESATFVGKRTESIRYTVVTDTIL